MALSYKITLTAGEVRMLAHFLEDHVSRETVYGYEADLLDIFVRQLKRALVAFGVKEVSSHDSSTQLSFLDEDDL